MLKQLSLIFHFIVRYSLWVIGILALVACASTPPPPRQANNICSVFKQYPEWYWATLKSYRHWHVPVPVQMAIINQESSFQADARPTRHHLLWFIPGARFSSAYGYPQALDQTWQVYQHSANHRGAQRDDFPDAVDFVGWYGDQVQRKLGIVKTDPYHFYLAYHEGLGGYARRTYLEKTWLKFVARKVQLQALLYAHQYQGCKNTLASRNTSLDHA